MILQRITRFLRGEPPQDIADARQRVRDMVAEAEKRLKDEADDERR